MKVLFLPNNTASLMTTNIKSLGELGIKGVGFNFSPLKTQDTQGIYCLHKDLRAIKFVFLFVYHLITATHIHWVYGGRSKIGTLLMKIVGTLKKNKVIEYCGSDARSLEKMCSDIPFYDINRFQDDEKKFLGTEETSLATQKRFKDFGFHALANSIEISDYMDEDINPKFFEYNRSVDLDYLLSLNFEKKENELPVIVHIPSNPRIKGTDAFTAAAKKLKEEGVADYKMITGVTHYEALKAVYEADIVVDQLVIGEYGVLAIEAMALGKPTVCFIRNKLEKRYMTEFEGFPIINANINNAYDVLKELLQDKSKQAEASKKGLPFVGKYHAPKVNAQRLKEIYSSIG